MFKKINYIFFLIIIANRFYNLSLVGGYEPDYKSFSKDGIHVVSVMWFDKDKSDFNHQLGTILSRTVIMTTWAPDYTSEREPEGFCILGFDLQSKQLQPEQVIRWKRAISLDEKARFTKEEEEQSYKIALIKLEKKIPETEFDGYTFAPVRPLDPKAADSITAVGQEMDAYLLKEKELRMFKVQKSAVSSDKLRWRVFFRLDDCPAKEDYKYQDNVIGAPLLYDGNLVGICSSHEEFKKPCTRKADNYQPFYFSASKILSHVDWINETITLLEKDDEKPKYSALCTFVMFYIGKDGQVKGLVTYLGNGCAITHYIDQTKVTEFKVLPGTPAIESNFDTANAISMKTVNNSKDSNTPFKWRDTQLAVVALENGKIKNQKIGLPTTLYPIHGSKCVVMIILYKDISSEELVWFNNFEFKEGNVTKIIHEIPVLIWKHKECSEYLNRVNKNSFCIRLDSIVRRRNHCKLIQDGSPVICNGQVTGIVNTHIGTKCEPHKPRVCTNVYKLKRWVRAVTGEQPYTQKELDAIKKAKERRRRRRKKIKKEDSSEEIYWKIILTSILTLIYIIVIYRCYY